MAERPEIKIVKKTWRESAGERWTPWKPRRRSALVTLYVLLVAGKRVDSFQKRRNAKRAAERVFDEQRGGEGNWPDRGVNAARPMGGTGPGTPNKTRPMRCTPYNDQWIDRIDQCV